jgi:hypothetical protein
MTDPDTLSESHVRLNNAGDKGEVYHYTIEGDYLVLASTLGCLLAIFPAF